MKTHPHNGIMMRISHGGDAVFLQPEGKGFLVTHTVPITDGNKDDRYHTGDLNNTENLQGFMSFLERTLKV